MSKNIKLSAKKKMQKRFFKKKNSNKIIMQS